MSEIAGPHYRVRVKMDNTEIEVTATTLDEVLKLIDRVLPVPDKLMRR